MNQMNIDDIKTEELAEVFQLDWKGIPYTLTWKPECYGGIIAHIELQSENKYGLPITQTGYLSHHIQKEQVEAYGWPVEYIQAWMREKTGELLDDPQGSLF